MTDEWKVDRTEELAPGVVLESLRRRVGAGAHRLRYGDRVLFVGPDEATTTRMRGGAIRGAIAQLQAGATTVSTVRGLAGHRSIKNLRRVGATWLVLDGDRLPYPTRQGRLILAACATRRQSGPDLNKIAHCFGARIQELRTLGYPIERERITSGPLKGQSWYWLERTP